MFSSIAEKKGFKVEARKLAKIERDDPPLIVDIVEGILWAADSDLVFTYVSPQSKRILGYHPEEWVGVPGFWSDHLHPEDRERAIRFCRDQMHRMQPHSFEYRMISKNGDVVWIRDLVSVDVKDGILHRVRGVMLDITKMKRTEEELRMSEERFRCLADAAFEGVVLHENGKIILVNESLCRMYGYSMDALRGQSVLRLTAPESHEIVKRHIRARSEEKYEAVLIRKDGTRFCAEIRAREIQLNGNPVRVTCLRDVTEEKVAQAKQQKYIEQERKAREEAERAMRQREDFLAIASHELRTPLTPLKMYLQVLHKIFEQAGEVSEIRWEALKQALRKVEGEYDRLSRLLEDLLDVSKMTVGQFRLEKRRCDLLDIVKGSVERMRPLLEKAGCEVRMELLPSVQGNWDPLRLEQVVMNLLDNAIKYAPRTAIRISLWEGRNAAYLEIRDQGIGIAKEHHEVIFERFRRAAPIESYKGMGIGLYIARYIAQAHGGNLTVSSQPEHGAAFLLSLPT